MFAIFENNKQSSEQVSTIDLASELLKLHRKEKPQGKFEIKARVKRIDKDGMQKKQKSGKDSLQWVSVEEFYRRLDIANSGDLL